MYVYIYYYNCEMFKLADNMIKTQFDGTDTMNN